MIGKSVSTTVWEALRRNLDDDEVESISFFISFFFLIFEWLGGVYNLSYRIKHGDSNLKMVIVFNPRS